MLAEFRALGGIVENVCLKTGVHGRGLFPCDPSKPVRIAIPSSLLVDARHFELRNGMVRVGEQAGIGLRARQLLEAYQQNFGWGVARRETENLLQMFREAPPGLRQLLRVPFQLEEWLEEPSERTAFEKFLRARVLAHNNMEVLLPVIGLANHGPGTKFEATDGVVLRGEFAGEIMVRYNLCDPLDIFATWGFASSEPFALSLALGFRDDDRQLVISREKVGFGADGTPFVPSVRIDGDKVAFSYLMLGHRHFPRIARGIFTKLMRDLDWPNPETLFDRIQHVNRMQFYRLMEVCEGAAPPLARLLRTMARYHLEAMSHHVGTRELGQDASTAGAQ